jgi:hypothetical protein
MKSQERPALQSVRDKDMQKNCENCRVYVHILYSMAAVKSLEAGGSHNKIKSLKIEKLNR